MASHVHILIYIATELSVNNYFHGLISSFTVGNHLVKIMGKFNFSTLLRFIFHHEGLFRGMRLFINSYQNVRFSLITNSFE
ncbi:MAG TPA: hypothetical protein DCY35_01745 [Prolixibacteraceae bacterium]|nr:hypothetical protein [Prolixibacteraceae bacterium]